MRFLILLFGFAGCLLTAFLGAIFFFPTEVLSELHSHKINDLDFMLDPSDRSPARTGAFLFIGAGFGLLGTLLGFFRCGWQGSLLLFIPLVGPAIISPITLVGTSVQALAAVMSMFVGPLPINPPDDDVEEDDD